MTFTKKLMLLAGLAPLVVLGLPACEREGPAERVGEAVDRDVERTGRSIEDAADDVEDAVDDAFDD